MRNSLLNVRSWQRARVVAVMACLLVFSWGVAQQFSMGQFKDFSVPEYHEPPHATQMKSLLQGAEALPQEGGSILIKKLKLQTFREDGTAEFVMRADDCVYDPTHRSASSPGFLEMRTADERFSTVGMGFLWREGESTLIISNSVHTVIRTGGSIATTP